MIADVLMPEMSGTELVQSMLSIRPELVKIFITGYADETVNTRIGEFDNEVIRKRFALHHFLARVKSNFSAPWTFVPSGGRGPCSRRSRQPAAALVAVAEVACGDSESRSSMR